MNTIETRKKTEQQELELLRQQVAELRKENHRLEQQLQSLDSSSYQHSMQSLEQVDEIIHQSTDLESLMEDFLDATLKIFGTDRAWLLYPCDPTASSWQVLMERTTAAYPGALALKADLPMTNEARDVFQRGLDSRQPVCYDQESSNPLPEDSAKQFSFQAQLTLAIYPHSGKPWLFGMHQCSEPRVWTASECKLFEQVGRRLPDGFSSFLTTRQLQESEQKYRSLVANLPGIIYRSQNSEQRIISYISETIKKLSGYPATDFVNNHVRTFASIIHPEDRQSVDEVIQQAIEEKKSFEHEYRLQSQAGKTLWVQDHGLAIYDQDGGFQCLDGLIIDITAKKSAEQKIRRLEGALVQSEKMRSLGTLAAGMAHEINNPLAAILQNLQVLQNRLNKRDGKNQLAAAAAGIDFESISSYVQSRQLNKIIESALGAGNQAARIVQTLLHFSRSGDAELQPSSLVKILDASLLLVGSAFRLKIGQTYRNIRIAQDVPTSLPQINCDPAQLEQVFLNLLKNAAHACAEKLSQLSAEEQQAFQPTIQIQLAARDEYLCLEISDNGVGVTEDDRSTLFDPFYSTKDPGQGPGLGLSLCYFIICNNHKGKMYIESTPGGGSSFVVELPL